MVGRAFDPFRDWIAGSPFQHYISRDVHCPRHSHPRLYLFDQDPVFSDRAGTGLLKV